MATQCVTTCAKNASQHPRHIVEKDKKKPRTKEEVQLEHQAKEEAKVEKVWGDPVVTLWCYITVPSQYIAMFTCITMPP